MADQEIASPPVPWLPQPNQAVVPSTHLQIEVLRPPVEFAQYTSAQFGKTLSQLRMRPSMGRVGSCYDNAVAESYFATLKNEIGTKVWATRAEARRAVFAYIAYYNRRRLHSTLKRQTPYEARTCYRQPAALAA